MNKKKLTYAVAVLGVAIFTSAPIFQPVATTFPVPDYTISSKKDKDEDDDDDFNGIRFKLFFPNRTGTTR